MLAERLVDNERLNADWVEVMHLADGHHEFEHPRATPCKYTWSRARTNAMTWNRVLERDRG